MPLLFVGGGGVGMGTRIQVVCEGDVAIGRVLLSVVLLRAVRVLGGSVVGDALVVSACGSWS